MALPSSGQLGMVDIANEMGVNPLTGLSLRGMSSIAGFSTPDTISEFYSYSQTDAERYKNAVNYTGYTLNGTEISAINTLFSDLNTYGLYSQIYAFYPMIGGGQAQILNAKSVSGVREYNYDLQFYGGWSFGAYGATGNGSYSTWIVPYTGYDNSTIRFSHLGTYTTVQGSTGAGWDITIMDPTNGYPYAFTALYYNPYNVSIYDYDYSDGVNYYSPSNYSGNNLMSYDDTNSEINVYQNEYNYADIYSTTEYLNVTTNVIGGLDYINGTYTDNTFGFITFGQNLSSGDATTYQNIINAFQTTLGRNTY
jgi:hypothetical protein